MSKNAMQLLIQVNDRWKLETDGMNNVLIRQLVDVDRNHHKAKEGGPTTRWIDRGWYGNLPTVLEPLLHKMAETGQTALPEESRSIETLMQCYKDCAKDIVKALNKLKK